MGKGMVCESNQIIGLRCTCRTLSFYSGDSWKLLENFEQKETQVWVMKKPHMAAEMWISKERDM